MILAICGDGHTVVGEEECDDGYGVGTSLHAVGVSTGCTDACTKELGWICTNDVVTSLKSNCSSMIYSFPFYFIL
jgi:hypothetical protein